MNDMTDTHISLAHGNGGRFMRELIDDIFARHLVNDNLDVRVDSASLQLDSTDIIYTTDGFTVQPLEFPGGDIGSLAVHGTTNDLAVAGAVPRFLALNAFIEEGMEIAQLERIVHSLARAAQEADVEVVAGDTKVLPRGEGGGLYLATGGTNMFLAKLKSETYTTFSSYSLTIIPMFLLMGHFATLGGMSVQ